MREINPEVIKDKFRITATLQRLHKDRVTTSIILPDTEEIGRTLILDINPENNTMLLNRLHSDNAHNKLLKSKSLTGHVNHKGARVRFKSNLVKLINEDGDLYYLVNIPEELSYLQRRSAHRVNLDQIGSFQANINLGDNNKLNGMIENISSGGLGVSFLEDIPATLKPGDVIPACSFNLQDGNNINCELIPRFIQYKSDNLPSRMGGEFIKLDERKRKAIERFVIYMDRKLINLKAVE